MFSGIVEAMAQVVRIDCEQTNKHFTLRNPFGDAFSIDQSIAHNGVCLTVVSSDKDTYTVTGFSFRIFSCSVFQILYDLQGVFHGIPAFYAFDIDACTNTAVIVFKLRSV